MGEKKLALSFFASVRRLPIEENREVLQAAEAQIADIYLEQAEKHPDAFSAIESTVVPQYHSAIKINPESAMAGELQKKVVSLQRKYDLVLFQMRNGRPTMIPPYFLRASQEIGHDSNVTFSPDDTGISESKSSSLYSRTDFMGRYTFYYKDFLIIAPEFRFNYTYYFNRIPEIYRNDNYLMAPALRTSYEHTLWSKPASVLFDYDYTYSARDINAEQNLEYSGSSHTLMIGERFNYFNVGETILRLRYRIFDSFNPESDAKTTSFVYEQIISQKDYTVLLISSVDMNRVVDKRFDYNSLMVRGDFIFPRFRDWFTPSVGMGLTLTDPINARDTRGLEYLINPNVRLSKTIGKNWRTNFKMDYQKNFSDDEERFAFQKYIFALDLEYIF
jgi:hypothetical protein